MVNIDSLLNILNQQKIRQEQMKLIREQEAAQAQAGPINALVGGAAGLLTGGPIGGLLGLAKGASTQGTGMQGAGQAALGGYEIGGRRGEMPSQEEMSTLASLEDDAQRDYVLKTPSLFNLFVKNIGSNMFPSTMRLDPSQFLPQGFSDKANRFSVDGVEYDIPEAQLNEFLKENPNARRIK